MPRISVTQADIDTLAQAADISHVSTSICNARFTAGSTGSFEVREFGFDQELLPEEVLRRIAAEQEPHPWLGSCVEHFLAYKQAGLWSGEGDLYALGSQRRMHGGRLHIPFIGTRLFELERRMRFVLDFRIGGHAFGPKDRFLAVYPV